MNCRVRIGLIIASIVPAVGLTRLLVNLNRDDRRALAIEWSARGEQDLPQEPAEAVIDFQTALYYEPDRAQDRFRLARALAAANQPREARAELLRLVSEEPSRGDVNLELARMAAQRGDLDEAVRYYHAAIDGKWRTGASTARRDARVELAKLLMAHGQRLKAQAELIGAIDDLPRDTRIVTDVATLLAQAGAQARALGLVRRALEIDPTDGRAAQLAGVLEFDVGDFRSARRDLLAASRHAPLPPIDRQTLEVADRALDMDPYLYSLTARARATRALRALAIAKDRLQRCRPALALLDRVNAAMKRRSVDLERNADLIDATMAVVFDIERTPPASCAIDTDDDRALAALASRYAAQSR